MNNSPEDLEKFIHQTLRRLPERRAPRTLESRVLAAIETRFSLPWWKRSYADWPLPARIMFLVISGGVAKLAIMAAIWVMGGWQVSEFTHAFAGPLAWFELVKRSVVGLCDFGALLLHSIPTLWLYGGVAAVAAIYVTLFGLGATAYRTLYAKS